jgi:hypothetical protein
MEIEKNVSIPRAVKYPLKQMDVGDSFLVEALDKIVMMKRIRSAIHSYTKGAGAGKKFVTRAVGEGVRCWRTE